jgi:hypothetical protein
MRSGGRCSVREAKRSHHDLARSFAGLLGACALFGDLAAFVALDPEVRRAPGTLPDSRIRGEDTFAGTQCRLLNWHVRELAAQTVVVNFSSCQPHPVICRFVAPVAEYEPDSVRFAAGASRPSGR